MAWLTEQELKEMGFKHIGKEVKISNKASIYNCDQISIGDYSRIDDFCVLSGKIDIARYVHVPPFCLLNGGTSGIYLEDFSGLSYKVTITAVSDDYSGRSMTSPLVSKEYKTLHVDAPITLEKYTIVGMGSCIMPSVVIREGSSIGAMSLVNKSTEEWSINIGIPSKKIKDRSKDIIQLTQQFLNSQK